VADLFHTLYSKFYQDLPSFTASDKKHFVFFLEHGIGILQNRTRVIQDSVGRLFRWGRKYYQLRWYKYFSSM